MKTDPTEPARRPDAHGLDLDGCEREPIHLLGAVQGFGFLLAAGADGIVRHASANLADHLGISAREAIGQPLSSLLRREALHEIGGALQSLHGQHQTERLFGLDLVDGRPSYDVAVHTAPDGGDRPLTVVEAEPSAAEPRFDPVATVKGMMSRLLSASGPEAMHDRAARQLRTVLGFDRVMVYRFCEDGSGEVVGESAAPRMEPYRGLRYPASDIPNQARALYRRNWLRLIADVGAEPVPVLSAPDATGAGPLDLSQSVLRSVSPVHLEYLRNMGVAASLSVSIMRGDELWGLLACHNPAPKVPSFQRRSAAELFGQLYSLQVESAERAQVARYEAEARAAHDRLLASTSGEDDIIGSLARAADELRALVPCDGVAVCTGGRFETSGEAPDRRAMVELLHSLHGIDTSRVFATDRIAERLPPAARYADRAAGMLAIPISRAPRDYLIFFRKELVRTVVWAGDPAKAAEPGGTGRLHPRRSFEAWRETVRGRCAPWTEPERRAAESLRVTLLEVVVRLTGAAAEHRRASHERQELLIAELNHRVRNILALIRALVSRSRESAETLEGFVGVLNGRIQSLARAHDQLTDDRWGPVPLRGMFESEFNAYLGGRQQGRTHLSGPPVLVEPQALTVLALVAHELATNAAKYGALSDSSGSVSASWTFLEDGALRLSWRESGGPPVAAPNRRGFGTTIIERSVPFELQGHASLRYERTGLEADFAIPARFVRAGEAEAKPAPTPRSAANLPRPSGAALLVEDSALLALDAEDILLKLGFDRVEVAGTVPAAMAAIERTAAGFGFALLDLNLGEDATSLPIAEELRRRGVPFAFATGYGKGAQLPAELAAAAPVIAKPYRSGDIARLVSSALGTA